MPLEMILGIDFMQPWYGLSDPAIEDALYDTESIRRFEDIDIAIENELAAEETPEGGASPIGGSPVTDLSQSESLPSEGEAPPGGTGGVTFPGIPRII
jgi:hypothetical protein